jgi:hypothetical protein
MAYEGAASGLYGSELAADRGNHATEDTDGPNGHILSRENASGSTPAG